MKLPFTLFSVSLLIIAAILVWQSTTADTPIVEEVVYTPQPGNSNLRFIENKGQWADPVQYKVRLNGGSIYLEENGLTYAFHNTPLGHGLEANKAFGGLAKVQSHALKVRFPGANPSPSLITGLPYKTYHNYFFGNDSSKWAGGVKLYGLITYDELYQGIDLRLYGYGDALKYDFIVAPGADPEHIKVAYKGADKLRLKKGNLEVVTSVRSFTEEKPYVYQIIDGKKVVVECDYKLKGNVLSYHFPNGYDTKEELIIDPTLIFSTYSGSSADNWGFTATYDDDGNAYAGGIEWVSGDGYPTTFGAFQASTNGGEREVTISKFDPTGAQLLYATYIGGLEADQPHSLIVNSNNQLVVMGRTDSPNFPVVGGSFDTGFNGGFDMFVSLFSEDGTTLIASTFLGGNGDDGVNEDASFAQGVTTKYNYGDDARGEVIVDDQDNIYVTGPTRSGNFPVSPGALQTAYNGGLDGTITKFNANLNVRIWSTYYGGSSDDASYTLKLDDQNNVFFAGGSNSVDLPMAGGGLSTNNAGGRTDGFVGKLSSNGANLLASTYLGTPFYDQVYLLELDDDYEVYVAGQTTGTWPIVDPMVGPIYRNANSRQFISKLDNNLSTFIYSTTFGSSGATFPNISPTAFLVDRCENVYVTGWGGATNYNGTTSGMPLQAPFQSGTDGNDIYMIVFNKDAQVLLFSSYLGGNGPASAFTGEHVDGGTCRFDKEGIIYHAVCAQCGNPGVAFPTTPNVYSPNSGYPSNCNLAIFKMDLDLAGVEAEFLTRDQFGNVVSQSTGCAPFTVNFDNQSVTTNPATTTYEWDFGDAGATSTQSNPTHTYQNPGTYEVQMIIIDPTSCNQRDTAYGSIVVFPPPLVEAGPDQIVCEGDTVQLTSILPAVGYSWSPSNLLLTSDTLANPVGVVFQNTTFTLTVTDSNGCEASDQTVITVDNTFAVDAGLDSLICRGGSVSLGATSNGGLSYNWFTNANVSINNANTANPTANNIDTTTVFYVLSENALGCEAIDSVTITVFEVFTLEDTFVCDGNSVVLSSQGGVSFVWTPNDGSLDDPNISSPTASPVTTTTYTVTATSAEGCISTKSVEVAVRDNPVAQIANIDPICIGDSRQFQASGGTNYSWDPLSDLDNPAVSDPIATPNQTTTYTVTVTDDFGCSDQESITLTVNPLPDIMAMAEADTICEGEQVQLLASGALTYSWSLPDQLSNPNIPDPIATPITRNTTYLVTGTDVNGCTNTTGVEVVTIERPITEITGDNFLCLGGEIELTASGGDYHVWSTGDTANMISLTPTNTVTIEATAYTGGCAGTTASITVDVRFEFPEAAFTFDPTQGWAPQTVNFTNQSTGASTYIWDFGWGLGSNDENPTHIYPSAGEYDIRLIAFSEQECPDTAFASILIENVTLHVPSGFTPNGDDYNENFIVGYYGIRSLNVEIYSRWGMKIYESNNPDFAWDGTYDGTPVPEGVYVYKITGIGENNLSYTRSGTVTLIR
ncbi:MAG: PKD domain-containing protein [Bacteroidota bacterium]